MGDALTFTNADLFNCWYGSEPDGPPAATVALWDWLEVGGVCDLNRQEAEEAGEKPDPNRDTMCEACDDADAHFWSVYGHYRNTIDGDPAQPHGVECITDATTKESAFAIAQHLGARWGLPVQER